MRPSPDTVELRGSRTPPETRIQSKMSGFSHGQWLPTSFCCYCLKVASILEKYTWKNKEKIGSNKKMFSISYLISKQNIGNKTTTKKRSINCWKIGSFLVATLSSRRRTFLSAPLFPHWAFCCRPGENAVIILCPWLEIPWPVVFPSLMLFSRGSV